MSDYGDTLRKERRLELAQRALPSEMLNEYGEITFATKTEGGASFPASDYAYVPDAKTPSTWKLRLTATPGGGPDAHIVGAAIAALGKGFRGNKVAIPADALPAVKAKVKAAWVKANPDKTPKDMPAVVASADDLVELGSVESAPVLVACGENDNDLEVSVKIDDISATPAPEVLSAVKSLVEAIKVSYAGYDIDCDVDIDVDQKSTEAADSYKNELELDVNGFSQTPPDLIKITFDSVVTAIKNAYGAKFDLEVDIDVDFADDTEMADDSPGPSAVAAPSPAYYNAEGTEELGNAEGTEELGTLPPALKAQLVKKLTAQSAKEKDPVKKAAIDAKIKMYS